MRGRSLDPRHLDVEVLAERAGELEGGLPLRVLRRLGDLVPGDLAQNAAESVAWVARGERRRLRGRAAHQTWLFLHADVNPWMVCQRCLQPVRVPLVVRCSYRFVADESMAAEADIDSDEDLLPITRSLDLPALIEDELLMALPLVPRHEGPCCEPLQLPRSARDDEREPEMRHPFESLSVLKTPKSEQ